MYNGERAALDPSATEVERRYAPSGATVVIGKIAFALPIPADAQSGDTITFSVTGTITLTSGQLVLDKELLALRARRRA